MKGLHISLQGLIPFGSFLFTQAVRDLLKVKIFVHVFRQQRKNKWGIRQAEQIYI